MRRGIKKIIKKRQIEQKKVLSTRVYYLHSNEKSNQYRLVY